jgi:hypothetical protein
MLCSSGSIHPDTGYTTTHIWVVYTRIRDVRSTLNDCNYSFTYPNRDRIEVFWNSRQSSFDLAMYHHTFRQSYPPEWIRNGLFEWIPLLKLGCYIA